VPNSIVIILHLLIHLTVLTTLWSKKFYYPYYLDEETEQEVISPGSPNQAVVEAEIKPKSMLWTPTSHQEKVGWWLERGQESWGRVFQEVKWTHRKAYRELEEGGWRWEMSFTLGIMWTAVLLELPGILCLSSFLHIGRYTLVHSIYVPFLREQGNASQEGRCVLPSSSFLRGSVVH